MAISVIKSELQGILIGKLNKIKTYASSLSKRHYFNISRVINKGYRVKILKGYQVILEGGIKVTMFIPVVNVVAAIFY